MPRIRKIKLKPLLRVRKPLKAVVYRAKVKQFDSVKYLNVGALARAPRALIEIGVIQTPVGSATVVADIRRGKVVALRPRDCPNCKPGKRKPSNSKVRQVISQVRVKGGVNLPIPVARMFGRMGLRIPIGPIIIVIGEPDMGFCIEWTRPDGTVCWWCLWDASGCMRMGPPL